MKEFCKSVEVKLLSKIWWFAFVVSLVCMYAWRREEVSRQRVDAPNSLLTDE